MSAATAALRPAAPAAGPVRQFIATVWHGWTRVLVTVLGVCEIAIALGAGSAGTLVLGVLGGVVLAVVPWLPRTLPAAVLVALLLAATVPFAVLTWWTIVVPLLAVVALAVGLPLLLRHPAGTATGHSATTDPPPHA